MKQMKPNHPKLCHWEPFISTLVIIYMKEYVKDYGLHFILYFDYSCDQ